jgi:hypothetical protein
VSSDVVRKGVMAKGEKIYTFFLEKCTFVLPPLDIYCSISSSDD